MYLNYKYLVGIFLISVWFNFGCEQKGKVTKSVKKAATQATQGQTTPGNGSSPNGQGTSQTSSIASISDVNLGPSQQIIEVPIKIDGLNSSSATCSSPYLSCSSSNTSVFSCTDSVTWTGTWPECKAVLDPPSHTSGTSVIEIAVNDGGSSSISQSFTITLDAINATPTLSSMTDISTLEDTSTSAIDVIVSDTDGPSQTCNGTYLSYTSGNISVVAASGAVTWAGTWPNCTAAIAPAPNATGTSLIQITAQDGTATSAPQSFTLTVNPVNDAPTISDVVNRTTGESTALTGVAVTIADVDSTLTCASLSATSSDTVLLPNLNISFSGSVPNCLLSLTPASGQTGSTTVTLSVTDGTLTTQDVMVLSVVLAGWRQEAYIKASNASTLDKFGWLLSQSGDTLAVAARNEDSLQTTITNGTGSNSDNDVDGVGAVYVYKRLNTSWAQEAYIKAANSWGGSEFGSGVSLSGDTLAVGSWREGNNANTITNGTTTAVFALGGFQSGAVYVYKRSGVNWTQEAYIKAGNNSSNLLFGSSVFLFGDSLAVGTGSESSNQSTITNGSTTSSDQSIMGAGAVYVYSRSGANWAQEAYIKAANVVSQGEMNFGHSVSLSGDTLSVGAVKESSNQVTITNGTTASTDITYSHSGAVFVYRKTGGIWAQEAYIKAANASHWSRFGTSVFHSGDTLAVGAPLDDTLQTTITNGTTAVWNGSTDNSGAAYVYRRVGTAWSQEAYVKASNGSRSEVDFGNQVSLSGNTLAVGAPWEDSNQTTITNGTTSSLDVSLDGSGATYVYTRSGNNWAQEAYIKASNADAGDGFGDVSLSGDTLSVGAWSEASSDQTIVNGTTASAVDTMSQAGAVYVYRKKDRLFDPDVFVSSRTSTSISFKWEKNLGATTTIKVSATAAGTATPTANCDGGTVLSSTDTSYTYTGLSANTKYGFRFCAWDGTNASEGTTIWDSTLSL